MSSDEDDIPLQVLWDRQHAEDDVLLNVLRERQYPNDNREHRVLGVAERSFGTEDDAPPEDGHQRGRKRIRHVETWIAKKRQIKRNRGESYLSSRGIQKNARNVLRTRFNGKCSRVNLVWDDISDDIRTGI